MNTPAPVPTVEALRKAFSGILDPEFGVSIEDLGLIYDVQVHGNRADVTMTLTSMYCPAGPVILDGIKAAAEAVPGVSEAKVNLVWDPRWSPERLSAKARAQLGWDSHQVGPPTGQSAVRGVG